MPLPTSYSWPIPAPTASAPSPPFNPGPPVASVGGRTDPRRRQFSGQGIRFANVPGGKASNIVTLGVGKHAPGLGQIFHVNTVLGAASLSDNFNDLSGVIRNRRRGNFKQVPEAVRHYAIQQNDRFGNPITPGVGQYPQGYQFVTIDPGIWNTPPTENVNFAVSRYAGAMMPGTGFIMKAGGLDATGTPSSGSETFNSGTGLWIKRPDMPGPKSYGASAILPNGDFFILGGSGSIAGDLTASFSYSSGVNAWAATPFLSSALVPRKEFQIVALDDGRIFAPGGCGLLSGTSKFTGSELFIPAGMGGVYANPLQGYWTGSIPIPFYPFNREGYTLTKLKDGTVLLLGGRDPISQQNHRSAFRYVPRNFNLPGSQDTWVIEPSMSLARSGHCAVLLDDGKVLVAGGAGGIGANLAHVFPLPLGGAPGDPKAFIDAEIFDPGQSVGPDVGWSGSITTVISAPFTGSDGGIYQTGSFTWFGNIIYGSGSWTPAGQMRKARSFFAMVPLRRDGTEGRVLVVGGIDAKTYLTSSEIFDYGTRTWTEVTPLQTPVARMLPFSIGQTGSSPYTTIIPAGETTGSLPNAFNGTQVGLTNG